MPPFSFAAIILIDAIAITFIMPLISSLLPLRPPHHYAAFAFRG